MKSYFPFPFYLLTSQDRFLFRLSFTSSPVAGIVYSLTFHFLFTRYTTFELSFFRVSIMSYKSAVLAVLYLSSSVLALPLPVRREVPQEHSHEPFLTSVGKSLALNNPDGIVDPVFGLLGNAAAANGLGKITDATCLQQATADQAFTNAKAAGDVQGQVDALIFRALERNSGKIGLATDACTSIKAVNPEIAAIQQHQDPASANAASINKAITLELARQIQAVGGNPQDALKAGTFAPGDLNDATAKGNTCDDANDANGCIFTLNLLVPDATPEEIDAAVAGAAGGDAGSGNTATATTVDTATASATATATDSVCPAAITVTVTAGAAATQAPTITSSSSAAVGEITTAPAAGNLQKFTGALGGAAAPAVTVGARGFQVAGSDSFLNQAAAVGRSCDIQHNKCANIANSVAGRAANLTVDQCDQQNTQCRAAAAAAA
ncbi:hypothetical protein Hypma_000906 [Hypsizygus marmoreus]|uniref:Uncharacterized protein n=1 Tax=Hypsizygus marmoreus TaxID=39966 RepID=A0A369J9Q1_HYPMA|nr:hypothetical protein Hypma_000906 [Hypsizygus marmoreus]